MTVNYDVEIPKSGHGRKAMPERETIEKFLRTKHKTMSIQYDTPDEAAKRRRSIDVIIKREKWKLKTSVSKGILYFKKTE